MRNTKFIVAGLVCCCRFLPVHAQSASDTAFASEHALVFADSLVKANFYQDWKTYVELSSPSVHKFYGGKKGYQDHVTNLYYRNQPELVEKPERLKVLNLVNDMDEWQCLVEKVRDTRIEYRSAKIYTYLIGRSLDNGETWTFVDVSQNTIENVIYIMPGIFDGIAIPEGKTVYDDEAVAQEPAAGSGTAKKTRNKPRK